MLKILHAAAGIVLRQEKLLFFRDGSPCQGHLLCKAAGIPVFTVAAWLEGRAIAAAGIEMGRHEVKRDAPDRGLIDEGCDATQNTVELCCGWTTLKASASETSSSSSSSSSVMVTGSPHDSLG